MTQLFERAGRLVYVMGPSGAGKDTLISYARERVTPGRIAFAHRYITRAAESGGENHVALTEPEFFARQEAGLFALAWHSHGFNYAIGSELDLWLARGLVAVVNGARIAWPQAQERYSGLRGVLIDAPLELRANRLARRGREDEAAIRTRLQRNINLPAREGILAVENAGSIEKAGETFIRMLDEIARS